MWIASLTLAVACAHAANSPIFEFHSGLWVNLHQFLMEEAASDKPPATDSPEWRAAVEYYRREMATLAPLSEQAAAVNNRLASAESRDDLPPDGLAAELAAALRRAAPAYRRQWWPEHDRANRAWIAAVQPLLENYGESIRHDIAHAYQAEWPAGAIRVDVSAYAGEHGAYTTLRPTHITISSIDAGYRGTAALEMLFHETSHSLDGNLQNALTGELRSRNRLLRQRTFEHAILFYTAGEITRRYVAGYEPYAMRNGIWTDGWPGGLEVLEKNWKPYLEGKIDFSAALRGIVDDYGVPKKVPQAMGRLIIPF